MSIPTISVTRHSASKMHISPPRINLRRAASYNATEKGPLSSTSSRFGFDHLAFYSPPPSPGLPLPQSQAPRMRRRRLSNAPRPSRVIRCFLWFLGLVLLFYLTGKSIRQHGGPESLLGGWVRGSWDGDQEYEMVGQDDLPDFPTPIIVTDRRGRAKWTISIPPGYEFPLTQREYVDMGAKCREVAQRVRSMHSHSAMTAMTTAIDQISMIASKSGGAATASETDKYFLDIQEAERQGFLPGLPRAKTPGSVGELLGVDGNSIVQKTVCPSSLTFVLESADAGLGKTLMALWMAYGLAQHNGRAFFIDDTRWAYGAYTDMFEPPPVPNCQPPPRHERLPFPRQARHLVVSAANARDVLGGGLDSDAVIFTDGNRGLDGRPGQRELYALTRAGHDALFRLTAPDREYVAARVKEQHRGGSSGRRMVGVHVRHGDCHPLEFQYHDSYIPLTQYVDAASELLNVTAADDGVLVVASDDPLVYDAVEFKAAGFPTVRAQELIRLAGKGEMDGGPMQKLPKNVMHKFTAESFGWEGGFFAPMFWHLGESPNAAATGAPPANDAPPTADTLRLRSFVGRSYLMDLAALSDMTEDGGVVCAVSATGCRILAVMMGEERAFGRGEWKNVDGGFGWHGFTW